MESSGTQPSVGSPPTGRSCPPYTPRGTAAGRGWRGRCQTGARQSGVRPLRRSEGGGTLPVTPQVPGAAPGWLTPSGGVPGSRGPSRLDPKPREEPAGGHVTDRGGAGGPEIASAAVPPAGCSERKAETGGRWLGAGAARPRPRRMLSPCPVRPRAHDGDTGAQSVSSRGESCAATRRGTPTSVRVPPRPTVPCAPLIRAPPLPSPAAVGFEPAPEFLTRSPRRRVCRDPLGPRGALGPGRAGPRDPPRGHAAPPRSLGPPRAFSFAFDNFLPAETSGYSAKAPDPFCLPEAMGLFTLGGGGGGGGRKKAQPKASKRKGMPRLEGEGISIGELSASEASVPRRKKAG